MTVRFSSDELMDLDAIVASAWFAAKALLTVSDDQASKFLNASSDGEDASALTTGEGGSEGSAIFLEAKAHYHRLSAEPNEADKPLAPFLTGGDINLNAFALLATRRICKSLVEMNLPNPALIALAISRDIRGYVQDAGAGLESARKQRAMAKKSEIYSALYKYLLCGLEGDLLSPVFTPYASLALQIGKFSHSLPYPSINMQRIPDTTT